MSNGTMDTPGVVVDPQAAPDVVKPPDPTEALRAQIEELKQAQQRQDERLEEAQRMIQDQANAKAVLEQRLAMVGSGMPSPAKADETETVLTEAFEEAQSDPKAAARKVARIIRERTEAIPKVDVEKLKQEHSTQLEQSLYIEEIKRQNPDIVGTPFELEASRVAGELMRKGKLFKEAIDAGVKEAKRKIEDMRNKFLKDKQASPPLPPGAQGETGSNPPPVISTPVPKEDEELKKTQEQIAGDVIAERRALFDKKARGKK